MSSCSFNKESQDWERLEILFWAVREFKFIICEAKISILREIHYTFTIILCIHTAIPLEVELYNLKEVLMEISECCSGIKETNAVILCTSHIVVIDHHTGDSYFEIANS